MVHAFNEDLVFRVRERRDEPIGPDSELVIVGPDQPCEEVIRVPRGLLKSGHDPAGSFTIQFLQVADACVGPTYGPRGQSPNRFLTCS